LIPLIAFESRRSLETGIPSVAFGSRGALRAGFTFVTLWSSRPLRARVAFRAWNRRASCECLYAAIEFLEFGGKGSEVELLRALDSCFLLLRPFCRGRSSLAWFRLCWHIPSFETDTVERVSSNNITQDGTAYSNSPEISLLALTINQSQRFKASDGGRDGTPGDGKAHMQYVRSRERYWMASET
jgi:hypothetical protein